VLLEKGKLGGEKREFGMIAVRGSLALCARRGSREQ